MTETNEKTSRKVENLMESFSIINAAPDERTIEYMAAIANSFLAGVAFARGTHNGC